MMCESEREPWLTSDTVMDTKAVYSVVPLSSSSSEMSYQTEMGTFAQEYPWKPSI